jgi:hypothetical protein
MRLIISPRNHVDKGNMSCLLQLLINFGHS